MSQNFEWRSEEDDGWEEIEERPKTAVAPNRRRYWFILTLLVAAVAGGIVLARQINRQLAATTAAIEIDVLATHNLLRDAAYRQDVELFITGLSGRDPAWVDAQQRLVQEETFLARPAFGLIPAGGEFHAVTHADLTLSSDLATAEFSYEEPYQAAHGGSETITLRQTAVYRRGQTNWLLIPPEADFWGETMTITGTHVIAQFPARDTAVVQRLVQDLDVKIDELCRYPGLDCSGELTRLVQFSTNPALLADLQDERVLWQRNAPHLHLPTPTLVGIPVDEAGYALLRRAYANHVLTAVASNLLDYHCCQGQLSYRALLDKLLSDVGVRTWPLTPVDYAQLLDGAETLDDALTYARQLWDVSLPVSLREDGWQRVYALTAFALASGGGDALSLTPGDAFVDWIRPFTDYPADFVDALLPPSGIWLQFVYRQALPALPVLPLPLPAQEVRLACLGAVYGYDLVRQELRVVEDGFSVEQMTPLADDSGLLLQGRATNGEREMWQAVLWRNGQRVVLYERPYQLDGKIYVALLQGERVVVYAQDLLVGLRGLTVSYFDVNACAMGDCVERPLSGITLWSPDGQQTLVWPLGEAASSGQLSIAVWLGDADGKPQQEIGADASFTAQWLDDTHFLLVRTLAESLGEVELWLGAVDAVAPTRLLTTSAVAAVLPAEMQNEPLTVTAVTPVSGQPQLVWLTLRSSMMGSPIYYVTLNWQTGELTFQYHPFGDHGVLFSPDGRWGAHYMSSDVSGGDSWFGIGVNLYNLEQRESWQANNVQLLLNSRSGQALDWSVDGQWLLTLDEYGFHLVAPDAQYDHYVVTGYPGCTAVAWENP